MPPRRLSIPRILKKLDAPEYDRDAIVRSVALALDAITPLALIPGIGPILELATDAIWMPAAEAIVVAAERAIAKKRERDA
jgi:hypothetical protein